MEHNYSSLSKEEIESLRSGTLGTEIEIEQITPKLLEIWKLNDTNTRASLLNIAIYSEKLGSLIENTSILQSITAENACRGLLLINYEGDSIQKRAWITTHCHLINGRKSVCSEQISIFLQNVDPQTTQGIIFSNLDSDLPFIFWWQGNLSNKLNETLFRTIDHLIIDSSSWDNYSSNIKLLEKQIENDQRIHDLSWIRSENIRKHFTTLFSSEQAIREIDNLNQINITFNNTNIIEAKLLCLWLSKKLQGTIISDFGELFINRSNNQKIPLDLKSSEEGASEFIEIKSDTSKFTIVREHKYLCLKSNLNGFYTERTLYTTNLDTPSLIKRAINNRNNDPKTEISILDLTKVQALLE